MTHEQVTLAHAALAPPATAQTVDSRFRSDLSGSTDSAFRLATVILGNAADAEEATQDALERAWRARTSLRDADRFEAWFQRILVNTCRDRVRKRRSRPTLMSISEAGEGVFPAGAEPADPFAATVAQDAIRRAFVRLNIDQRVVIAMRFYLDLEVDEIARRLGTRQGTIKSRLHRALKTLRDSWDGDR